MSKIKKGDRVIVIAGKNKGVRGVVLKVLPVEQKIIVENVNMAKRHVKGNPAKNSPGGVVEKELPLHISNVSIFNPLTKKPDRVGMRTLDDGRKVRFFKSNNEVIDI